MYADNDYYFRSGSHNVICDKCARKLKSHEVKKTYDGFMMCSVCWYPQHPTEYMHIPTENVFPRFIRPNQELTAATYGDGVTEQEVTVPAHQGDGGGTFSHAVVTRADLATSKEHDV